MGHVRLFLACLSCFVLFFFLLFFYFSPSPRSFLGPENAVFAPQRHPLGFRCHLSSMRITNKGGQLGQCAHRRLVSPYFSEYPCDQFLNRSRGVGGDAVPAIDRACLDCRGCLEPFEGVTFCVALTCETRHITTLSRMRFRQSPLHMLSMHFTPCVCFFSFFFFFLLRTHAASSACLPSDRSTSR